MGELENFVPAQVVRSQVLATLLSDVTVVLTDDPNVVIVMSDVEAPMHIRRHPRRGVMVQTLFWSVWFEREECPDVIERWWPGDPVPIPTHRHWWQRKAIR